MAENLGNSPDQISKWESGIHLQTWLCNPPPRSLLKCGQGTQDLYMVEIGKLHKALDLLNGGKSGNGNGGVDLMSL